MKTYNTGSLYRTGHGDIVIVVDELADDKVRWISYAHGNVSGTTKFKDTFHHKACDCRGLDSDCPDCKGKGEILILQHGMESAVFLARSVKDFILNKLTKDFE